GADRPDLPDRPRPGRGARYAIGPPKRAERSTLLAKAELRDERAIACLVLALEIIEQRAALVDQHQQAAARMIVLGVRLEMFGEVGDPFGQDRDLHLGAARVVLRAGVVLDDLLLA